MSKAILTSIGIYQLLGGIYCLSDYLIRIPEDDYSTIVLKFFFCLPFIILSITAGLYAIITPFAKITALLTKVNQSLQVVQFKFLGLGLYYTVGPYLGFGYIERESNQFIIDESLFNAVISVKFGFEESSSLFFINLVPIAILFLMQYMHSNRLKENKS
jgi:hypothetical protein